MSTWRLDFDAARCDGYGMCSLMFPDRISLDPWGFAHVESEPFDGPAALRHARRAVRCCPRQALALREIGAAAPPAPAERTECADETGATLGANP